MLNRRYTPVVTWNGGSKTYGNDATRHDLRTLRRLLDEAGIEYARPDRVTFEILQDRQVEGAIYLLSEVMNDR